MPWRREETCTAPLLPAPIAGNYGRALGKIELGEC
jgi:hypothetical protein